MVPTEQSDPAKGQTSEATFEHWTLRLLTLVYQNQLSSLYALNVH